MEIFNFLNPAKQTAASGSKWAIRNFLKAKQINPRLTEIEVVNNLLTARYMRVSLEPDQETRLEHYDDSIELADVMELVMATLDIELDVNPLHNPEGFVDAAIVVEKNLAADGIHSSNSEHDFENKWNNFIRPQRRNR